MVLTPDGEGGFRRTAASTTSATATRRGWSRSSAASTGIEGPEGYAFFAADSQAPELRADPQRRQLAELRQPVRAARLPGAAGGRAPHRAAGAFDAALNTVNIGKFNLGFASIGICEHALHEAITHADSRVLYGMKVTDFPHVRQAFTDSYARLIAMKLFARRAIDYMRSAHPEDRRYLLSNPLTKMKVTTEGERVIDALWDVMAAKGFERDMYFEMAARDIRGAAEARGHRAREHGAGPQVHGRLPVQPGPSIEPRRAVRRRPGDDEFLFRQGPARGLSQDPVSALGARPTSRSRGVPNVARFARAGGVVRSELLSRRRRRTRTSSKDLDYLLDARRAVHADPLRPADLRAGVTRSASPPTRSTRSSTCWSATSPRYAVELHGKTSSTEAQQEWALTSVRKPVADPERFDVGLGEGARAGGDLRDAAVAGLGFEAAEEPEQRGVELLLALAMGPVARALDGAHLRVRAEEGGGLVVWLRGYVGRAADDEGGDRGSASDGGGRVANRDRAVVAERCAQAARVGEASLCVRERLVALRARPVGCPAAIQLVEPLEVRPAQRTLRPRQLVMEEVTTLPSETWRQRERARMRYRDRDNGAQSLGRWPSPFYP